jgi:hypothetical protein
MAPVKIEFSVPALHRVLEVRAEGVRKLAAVAAFFRATSPEPYCAPSIFSASTRAGRSAPAR